MFVVRRSSHCTIGMPYIYIYIYIYIYNKICLRDLLLPVCFVVVTATVVMVVEVVVFVVS